MQPLSYRILIRYRSSIHTYCSPVTVSKKHHILLGKRSYKCSTNVRKHITSKGDYSYSVKMSADGKDLFSYLGLHKDDSEFVALSMGAPGPDTLQGCNKLMTDATQHTLSDPEEERYTFQYGPCKGDPGFCEQMAKFLSKEYNDDVKRDDLMVTAGATQGLHLVATVMFDKHTPVFMEDPTYFIAVKLLAEDYGMNVIPVPTDDEGIDVNILEELLIKHKPSSMEGLKSPFWTFLYCIPTYNNPKGFCISPERAEALVKLARKHDVLLLAEDVYNMIHFYKDGHCPPRLLAYDKKTDPDYIGHVMSNCTFSKILAPGLRVGWIEAPPRIMHCLEKSNTAWSGGSFNHYMSKIMASAIKHDLLSQHLQKLRAEYGERMNIACEELQRCLPPEVTCNNPQGGFFIWLELPTYVDTFDLLKICVDKYKMNYIFGKSTSPTGSCSNCVRFSISYCPKDKIREGIQRFCKALKEYMAQHK